MQTQAWSYRRPWLYPLLHFCNTLTNYCTLIVRIQPNVIFLWSTKIFTCIFKTWHNNPVSSPLWVCIGLSEVKGDFSISELKSMTYFPVWLDMNVHVKSGGGRCGKKEDAAERNIYSFKEEKGNVTGLCRWQ